MDAIEEQVLAGLRSLRTEKQQEILDFVEFLRNRNPRLGWGNQFRQMAEGGDDLLLDAVPPSLSTLDKQEWLWE
jgi:hypothetical protein